MVIRVTRADRGDLALSFELGFNSVGAQLLFLEAKVYSIGGILGFGYFF